MDRPVHGAARAARTIDTRRIVEYTRQQQVIFVEYIRQKCSFFVGYIRHEGVCPCGSGCWTARRSYEPEHLNQFLFIL